MEMIKQMAVFIENRKGRLLELTKTLGDAGIDLVTLSIADTKDFGILRCITSDNDKAEKVLKAAGFTVTSTELFGAEVADEPGGLAKILEILNDNDINVEYLYSYARKVTANAVILFKVTDEEKAIRVLKENNVKILTRDIIQG